MQKRIPFFPRKSLNLQLNKMKIFSIFFVFFAILGFTTALFGKNKDDEESLGELNVKLGLQSLASTVQDPRLLAELLEMAKDPDVQREVQAMMEDPDFLREMEKLQPQIDAAIDGAAGLMQDAEFMTKATGQAQEMVKEMQAAQQARFADGAANAQLGLDTAAASFRDPEGLQQTLEMLKDPAIQAEVDAMMKNPAFVAEMEKYTKNPQFKETVQNLQAEMASIMEDPDKMAEALKMAEQMMAGAKVEL